MIYDQKSTCGCTGEAGERCEENLVGRGEGGASSTDGYRPTEPLEVTKFSDKDVRRFWSHVDVRGPDDCWLWTAACSGDGYGTTKVGPKVYGAHRLSYLIAHGRPIRNWHICHHCDTPKCVNPKHLFLGTHMDNMNDRDAKGRQWKGPAPERKGQNMGTLNGHWTMPERTPKGEWHHGARLKESDVLFIREMFRSKQMTQPQLAQMFKMTQMNVSAITTRRTWRHLP